MLCNDVISRDEDYLLSKPVNNGQDSIKPGEWWEFLDIIYENGISQTFGDGKLLEKSIRLVMLRFELHTSNTRLAELLYISMETRPGVSAAD